MQPFAMTCGTSSISFCKTILFLVFLHGGYLHLCWTQMFHLDWYVGAKSLTSWDACNLHTHSIMISWVVFVRMLCSVVSKSNITNLTAQVVSFPPPQGESLRNLCGLLTLIYSTLITYVKCIAVIIFASKLLSLVVASTQDALVVPL